MVQSPFRDKKPKSNYRPSLFSKGPGANEQQRTTIWIGGDAFVGEGRSSSFVEKFRGMFGSGETSLASRENDAMEAQNHDDDDIESTKSSTEDPEDDARRGSWSVSTINDQIKDGGDTEDEDIFLSPDKDSSSNTTLADIPPIPPSKNELRSVSIGGQIIIGERLVPNNKKSNNTVRRSNDAGTSNRLRTPTVESREEMDLEAPSHCNEDENDANYDHTEGNRSRSNATSLGSKAKLNGAEARHGTPKEMRGSLVVNCHYSRNNHHRQQLHTADDEGKRRRLSKRARTRLTTIEVNSHIQPGRNCSSMETMGHLEKRRALTLPRTIEFFRRIEIDLILVNVLISVALTSFVLYAIPISWQSILRDTSPAVSVLGAFLSFALVFRTQACYARWWEARTQWGRMTSACISLAGQARTWFRDEEAVDRFLTHCVVFPYACKAALRGNALTDRSEEGPRFLKSNMLTDADLGAIVRRGRPPFACLEYLRRTAFKALQEGDPAFELPPAMLSGALLAMEQILWELNLNFGACLKINSTRMPASYTVFMRSFVVFFFVLASLSWAPSMKWLTPVITGFMVFSINTVIVIGDQMMRPFDLQWAGLPLQKFCVAIEHEIMSVSRRHADIVL